MVVRIFIRSNIETESHSLIDFNVKSSFLYCGLVSCGYFFFFFVIFFLQIVWLYFDLWFYKTHLFPCLFRGRDRERVQRKKRKGDSDPLSFIGKIVIVLDENCHQISNLLKDKIFRTIFSGTAPLW